MAKQRRYALLLGSTKKIDPSMADIDRKVRDANLQVMRETLLSLGEYNFTWPDSPLDQPKRLVNPRRSKLISVLDSAGKAAQPKANDLLLFYYFGYSWVGEDTKLILGFADVQLEENPERFTIDSVLHEIINAGFKKAILIADCCHSGIAKRSISVQVDQNRFLLMASSTSGWSHFDEAGGKFTRCLAELLPFPRTKKLRVPQRDVITFDSWFNIAEEELGDDHRPSRSGALGDEILTSFEIEVQLGVRKAPKKSIYTKLYDLLFLISESVLSLGQIADRIRCKNLDAFRIISYQKGRPVERFIKDSTIYSYLCLASDIGLAKIVDGRWELTKAGRQAIKNDGEYFNKKLLEGVLEFVQPYGLTKQRIKELLHDLVSGSVLPNIVNIEREMTKKMDFVVMRRKELRICLRLLSYAGLIQRATPDTFFIH